jgi:hypothetical protein
MSEDSQPRLLKSDPTPWDHDPNAENSNQSDNQSDEYEPEWVEGITLVMVISGITLVVFLMLLDMSIVSTV